MTNILLENKKVTMEVLREVLRERLSQDGKWGEQNHDPFTWLAILGEEVGESNQAALDSNMWYQGHKGKFKNLQHYREEVIQIAAVAVAMVECLDRKIRKGIQEG